MKKTVTELFQSTDVSYFLLWCFLSLLLFFFCADSLVVSTTFTVKEIVANNCVLPDYKAKGEKIFFCGNFLAMRMKHKWQKIARKPIIHFRKSVIVLCEPYLAVISQLSTRTTSASLLVHIWPDRVKCIQNALWIRLLCMFLCNVCAIPMHPFYNVCLCSFEKSVEACKNKFTYSELNAYTFRLFIMHTGDKQNYFGKSGPNLSQHHTSHIRK